MKIRPATTADQSEWLRLRSLLWEEGAEDHPREIAEFFAHSQPNLATFVIDRGDGCLGGFVEAGTRNYAEGCDTSPVGFIEGWYVDEDLRRQGLGRALIAAAEAWARGLGLTEMASDCDLGNDVSLQAHTALGYEEVERIICFRKLL